jgi:hypothetical protein
VDATSGQALVGVLVGVRSGRRTINMTSVRTSQHGHFYVEITDSSVAMSFFSEGYERLGYALPAVPRHPIRIELRRSVPVRGTLVDPQGIAAVKARVYLTPLQPGGLQRVLQAVTDNKGRYEFDGVGGPTTYRLEAAFAACERQLIRGALGWELSALGEVKDVLRPCR